MQNFPLQRGSESLRNVKDTFLRLSEATRIGNHDFVIFADFYRGPPLEGRFLHVKSHKEIAIFGFDAFQNFNWRLFLDGGRDAANIWHSVKGSLRVPNRAHYTRIPRLLRWYFHCKRASHGRLVQEKFKSQIFISTLQYSKSFFYHYCFS